MSPDVVAQIDAIRRQDVRPIEAAMFQHAPSHHTGMRGHCVVQRSNPVQSNEVVRIAEEQDLPARE